MIQTSKQLASLNDFLVTHLRSRESFALTAPGPHYEPLLQALAACAVPDNNDFALILCLDPYRKSALTSALGQFLNVYNADFPNLDQNIKIASCHDLASRFLFTQSSHSKLALRRTFRILVYISDVDLGSLGLAYYEWLLGSLIGDSIPVGYFCPSSYISPDLLLWFEKHGVSSLHHFASTTKSHASQLPVLLFSPHADTVPYTDDALIASTSIPLLSSLAESIHRHGGKTHAYYMGGDKRGHLRKNSAAMALHTHTDGLPQYKSWKNFTMLCPQSASLWRVSANALTTPNQRLLARSTPELLAGAAILSSPNDDVDSLLLGPFSRALIGAYLNFVALQYADSPILPVSTLHAAFIEKLVPQYLAYWRSQNFFSTDDNILRLTSERARAITMGTNDLTSFSKQWLHTRTVSCFEPNGVLLGSCSPIRAAFSRSHHILLGDRYYDAVLNEYSPDAAYLLIPASEHNDSPWFDASSALFGFDAAQHVKQILISGSPDPTLYAADPAALRVFQQLKIDFHDLPLTTNFAEYASPSVKWWTFAGGIINASLAAILLTDHRVQNVHFSNCTLQFSIAPQLTPSPKHASIIIYDALAHAENPSPLLDQLTHTWFWLPGVSRWFPLLGTSWQSDYIKNVLKKQSLAFKKLAAPTILSVTSFHQLMETSLPSLSNSHTNMIQQKSTLSDDINQNSSQKIDPVFPQNAHQFDSKNYKNFQKIQKSSDDDSPKSPSEACFQNNTPTDFSQTSNFVDGYYKLLRGNGSKMHTHLPWSIVNTTASLNHAVDLILREPFIGLDVETTLFEQKLCFVQIGCRAHTYLIDPLYISIAPLAQVFSNPKIIKVIHNKSFECRVLGKLGFQINNIIDTCSVSKKLYGTKTASGQNISHKLSEVCLREFNYTMDKTNQTSRWETRPLSDSQLEYAALDAEILVHLYHHFFIHSH